MSISNASETRLSVVTESAWGTTPANPGFRNVRMTGESLNFDTETVTSNEIRPDRNVADLARVARSASGGFNFELSYGSFEDFMESALFGTWSANQLKNGRTGKSFTLEKTFEAGTTDAFLRYVGMYANTFALNCEAGAIVTGSFGFIGKGGSVATSALSGAVYTPANTKDVMNATSDFGSLTVTGISATPKIMSVGLSVNNNLRSQRACGNIEAVGVGTGRFECTGNIRAYFEDADLYQAYLDNDELSLSWILGSVATEKYQIYVPRLKIETATVVAGGNDQDVMVDLTYRALIDASSSPSIDASLVITRGLS